MIDEPCDEKTYADSEIHELVILHQRFHHPGELSVAQKMSDDLFVALVVHDYEADQNAGDASENCVLHVAAGILNNWEQRPR